MELVISNITPAVVQMNIEEVEKYMSEVKEKYQNIVFTSDEIKIAKEERTKLNKLEKNIFEVRKKIEKEGMADIKRIIDILKAAEKDTKALSNNIGEQIKIFEEEEWKEKLENISEIKERIYSENKLLEKYFVIDEAWKKKTMTLKKIEEDIKEKFDYWNKRYELINSQLEGINQEIENKVKFEEVSYLMLEDTNILLKKLVDIKNERKIIEENIKRKAEEEKQKALAELEAKKEREKQEAIEKAKNEPTGKNEATEDKTIDEAPKLAENTKKFDTTIRFPKAPIEFLKELKKLTEIYEVNYELIKSIELGDDK